MTRESREGLRSARGKGSKLRTIDMNVTSITTVNDDVFKGYLSDQKDRGIMRRGLEYFINFFNSCKKP